MNYNMAWGCMFEKKSVRILKLAMKLAFTIFTVGV